MQRYTGADAPDANIARSADRSGAQGRRPATSDASGAVRITIGAQVFRAALELERAPKTCAAFRSLLPLRAQIIHVRWSGEALWIPGGDAHLALAYENNTSHPAPGEVLLYPGGQSEMELLIAYGATLFSSKAGQLSGNHVATVVDGRERLSELGRAVLWQGAQPVLVELE